MRRTRVAALALTLLAVAACSRGPKEVYLDMTTAAMLGDREGFLEGFTDTSRAQVEALISLSEAYGLREANPFELLVFDAVEDVTTNEAGDEAILLVRTRGKKKKILMVQQDGQWRIDTEKLEAFWETKEGRSTQ